MAYLPLNCFPLFDWPATGTTWVRPAGSWAAAVGAAISSAQSVTARSPMRTLISVLLDW